VCYIPLERAHRYWPTDRVSGVGLTPMEAYNSREAWVERVEVYAARVMNEAFSR
jgi:hypothetical protein